MEHPWLLFEDAHVNMVRELEHFDNFTKPGDYLCVEDTNPLAPSQAGQGFIKELGYKCLGPAKLNSLRRFLSGRADRYLVDQRYVDMFG